MKYIRSNFGVEDLVSKHRNIENQTETFKHLTTQLNVFRLSRVRREKLLELPHRRSAAVRMQSFVVARVLFPNAQLLLELAERRRRLGGTFPDGVRARPRRRTARRSLFGLFVRPSPVRPGRVEL